MEKFPILGGFVYIFKSLTKRKMLKVLTSKLIGKCIAAFSITTVGFCVIPIAEASAATMTYSAVTAIAPATPAQFQGSGGGDGWGLAFTSSEIFQIFHHSQIMQVNCHVQATAEVCPENQYPVTITDNTQDAFAGDNFAVPGQPSLYIDPVSGKLFAFGTANGTNGNNTAGVVCVDTNSTAADPFCGFTPLSGVGEASFSWMSNLSNSVKIGSHFYNFNYHAVGGGASANTVLCFDLVTESACPGQPFAVTQDQGSTVTTPAPALTQFGTDIVIPFASDTQGAELTCFDTLTQTTCSGSWPISNPEGSPWNQSPNGPLLPVLDQTGASVGLCFRGSQLCIDATGATIANPNGLYGLSLNSTNSNWGGGAVEIGQRIIFVSFVSSLAGVDCFDYSTNLECPGYPLALPNQVLTYSVNLDPNRPGCVWTNADSGSGQIQNFDVYTQGACGSSGTRVILDNFVPTGSCKPTTFSSLQILSPEPSSYIGGTAQFVDMSGNNIGAPVVINGHGSADISGLNLSAQTTLPQAVINLPGAPNATVTVRLTWQGSDASECALVPEPPTSVTASVVDAGNNTGNFTVRWHVPAFDGGTPVTGYTVTAQPGGQTCTTGGALTCAFTGLASNTNYAFSVVATNRRGNSIPATSARVGLAPGPAQLMSAPHVTGSVTIGQTLTSSTGTWNTDNAVFSYQWYSCTHAPAVVPNIDPACSKVGGNQATYDVQNSDLGNYIGVTVSDQGTDLTLTSASSNFVGPIVAPGPATNSLAPVITGNLPVGQTLSATTGTWTSDTGSFVYQWSSCNVDPTGLMGAGVSCVVVGENSATYTTQSSDIGRFILVSVTDTGTDGSTTAAASNVLGPIVANALPRASVFFANDSIVLSASAKATLNNFANLVISSGMKTVTVTGAADRNGNRLHNLYLSKARAKAVWKYLAKRMSAQGHANVRFIVRGIGIRTASPGLPKNRRVDVQ